MTFGQLIVGGQKVAALTALELLLDPPFAEAVYPDVLYGSTASVTGSIEVTWPCGDYLLAFIRGWSVSKFRRLRRQAKSRAAKQKK